MGRGVSKVGAGQKVSAPAPTPTKANTPSGVDRIGFLKMSSSEKLNLVNQIKNDKNIKVPAYVDDSDISKVMYALGMNKPTEVVDDATFDSKKANGEFLFNKDMFRTVSSGGGLTATEIAQQNLRSDYTQMSGDYSSAYGRALYFAGGNSGLAESMDYGRGGSKTMRANLRKDASIGDYNTLKSSAEYKTYSNAGYSSRDSLALAALSQGLDGWRNNFGSRSSTNSYHYTMVINREKVVSSSTVKNTASSYNRSTGWNDIGKTSRTRTIV